LENAEKNVRKITLLKNFRLCFSVAAGPALGATIRTRGPIRQNLQPANCRNVSLIQTDTFIRKLFFISLSGGVKKHSSPFFSGKKAKF
jgi:hypothetical protein